MNEIQSTKSLLAKLLASENITVEHGNYQTASFDVKNRVIRLPIFKYMSGPISVSYTHLKLPTTTYV